MLKLMLDEQAKNGDWLHRSRQERMQLARLEAAIRRKKKQLCDIMATREYLSEARRERIRRLVDDQGGYIEEDGAIMNCSVFTLMIEEILLLGGMVYYSDSERLMRISNWGWKR